MPLAERDYVSQVGIVWRPDPNLVLEVVSDLSADAQRANQRTAPDLQASRTGRFPQSRGEGNESR